MPEWFSAFLKSIDKEVMTLLAVGVATFLSTWDCPEFCALAW